MVPTPMATRRPTLATAPKAQTANQTITQVWPCLRAAQGHTVIDVSVSPNAKKTELVGWHDGALRIRLQAPPVDGAANEALRKWLAQQLGLPHQQVKLLRGDTSRRKQWQVELDCAQVAAWLAAQPAMRNPDAPSDSD